MVSPGSFYSTLHLLGMEKREKATLQEKISFKNRKPLQTQYLV